MTKGAATAMAKENSSESATKVKMTMYVEKPIAKEFKKLAIDLEKDYSELGNLALTEYIHKHRNNSSRP